MHRRPLLGGALLAAVTVALTALPVAPSTAAATADYRNPRKPVERRVEDLLARMTLAEKVGQMTQAERNAVDGDPAKITTLALGSLLSGGGSTPAANTPAAWADMVDGYQRRALATRLGIPLLYGVDSVHGHGNLVGATVFPHNIALGATRDPELAREAAHITAIETRATGPQWVFAPCVCVARDDRWGRTYESFGETPELVTSMETQIDGFQGRRGSGLDRPDRVLATVKHYAGDGSTAYGSSAGSYRLDQGVTVTSRERFRRIDLAPYVTAVQQYRVGSIMPSFSSVDWTEDGVGNPVKMSAHHELLTEVLKQKTGFDGFLISDWDAISQLPGDYPAQVRASVNAGMDMFMVPYSAEQFEQALLTEVTEGRVARSRIDDAVRRILRAKFELGLFEHPFTDRRYQSTIGSAEHRAVAREAVAKSQVLLKNEHHALPLKRTDAIYVAGVNADDPGNQAGGWTVTWQGASGATIPATTILEGIREYAPGAVYSADASAPVGGARVGIVVVGETPYAEGVGDVGNNGHTLELSAADRATVEKVCAAVPTCVVLDVAGRPQIVTGQLPLMDAFVMSWLPGSEGGGVADVLFGARRFSGKLPVSWPRAEAQEPLNAGDAGYDPLFRYGAGLTTGR
ncbi:glycoside hydrolase family 3 protein [Kitasatospora sp. NPDC096147]|uniref:glycoside hydrolase family 3 protein n=1 Tax=Kitasatospora sp. NPDC096147 TaxID=3364093 RepID=UPI00380E2370